VLDNLREAKASAGADWQDIEQRATDNLKKPTFESIAAYATHASLASVLSHPCPSPCLFHCVLASFLLRNSTFTHRDRKRQKEKAEEAYAPVKYN
jgi:hypothetical protein